LTVAAAAAGQPPPPVFKFEAGPSLFSGLSPARSPNPLKSVFQMVGEEPAWVCYNTWGAHLPECPEGFDLSIGADAFKAVLQAYGGPTALSDWERLAASLRPLTQGIMGLPSAAVRSDPGVLLTLGVKYPLALLRVLRDANQIVAPFDLDKLGIKDPFLKNYLDLLAFLLQGLPANETLTAVVAYMVEDFYRPGAVMEYPVGGSGSLAKALCRAIVKHGGAVHTRAPVARVVVEHGRAVAVELAVSGTKKQPPSSMGSTSASNQRGRGKVVRARKGVVSNADLHGTFALVPTGLEGCAAFDAERAQLLGHSGNDGGSVDGGFTAGGAGPVPLCKSFMHLHLAVKEDAYPGLRDMILAAAEGECSEGDTASTGARPLPPQWTVVNSWEGPIDEPGKVVVVSMPTLLDSSMAPPGYHVIHAYAAGNEPFEVWEQFDTEHGASSGADANPAADRSSSSNSSSIGGGDAAYRQDPAYEALKQQRAEPLWRAIERRLPLIRQPGVCSVVQIGTPLTHRRFLRRHRGNYGPAIAAGNAAGLQFPAVTTPLPGYFRCGDSTTSGIGVPAVASSGAQCANALLTVWEQLEMNAKIRM
jgi:phytoene dehydrogenase-like protein